MISAVVVVVNPLHRRLIDDQSKGKIEGKIKRKFRAKLSLSHLQGECGSNVEYVLNIADFMREEVYGVDDEHLFMLEMHILSELQRWTDESQSFQAKVVRGFHARYSSVRSDQPTLLAEQQYFTKLCGERARLAGRPTD